MLAACRAQVDGNGDLGDAGGDGMVVTDDMPGPIDGGCAVVGPEICDNGCDDDQNGFTDADDPACTTQVIGTSQLAAQSLRRLVLEPTPHQVEIDGNAVPAGGFAMLQRAFSPDVFLVFDNAT